MSDRNENDALIDFPGAVLRETKEGETTWEEASTSRKVLDISSRIEEFYGEALGENQD